MPYAMMDMNNLNMPMSLPIMDPAGGYANHQYAPHPQQQQQQYLHSQQSGNQEYFDPESGVAYYSPAPLKFSTP